MQRKQRAVHERKSFLSAGLAHSSVVLGSGELMTWGLARQYQLGLDRITEKERRAGTTEVNLEAPKDVHHSPDVVPTLKASGDVVTTVACGSSHTLAVTRAGAVFSWGSGAFGRLGHGSDADVRIPRQIEFKRKRIAKVSCGPDHCAAVSEVGEVLTWGAGSYGNLGHGDNTDQSMPKLVDGLVGKPCIAAVCGSKHTMALSQSGVVLVWGHGGGGRLGSGDTRGLFRPKVVEALKDIKCGFIAAGESHSLALTSERGQGYTWGLGDYGKLGHGDSTPQLLPRQLEFFRTVREL